VGSENRQEFYILRGPSSEGPFTASDLAALISNGTLRARDRINVKGALFSFPATALPFFGRLTTYYHDWLLSIGKSADLRGTALLSATVPLGVVSVILGFGLFPPGLYPRLLLAAPGLLVAVAFAYVFGFVVFTVPRVLGIVLSTVVALMSFGLLLQMLKTLWR
jgi:hypothetical protein